MRSPPTQLTSPVHPLMPVCTSLSMAQIACTSQKPLCSTKKERKSSFKRGAVDKFVLEVRTHFVVRSESGLFSQSGLWCYCDRGTDYVADRTSTKWMYT